MSNDEHISGWGNNLLTPSITHRHAYNGLFSCLPWGKVIMLDCNGTFCAPPHWLYFLLCHSLHPWSSFPLRPTLAQTFFPKLSLFSQPCLPLCLSVCLRPPSGVVMSIHSKAQRFEVLPNGTLVIQNVQLQDRGTYICSAQSFMGRDRWDDWL